MIWKDIVGYEGEYLISEFGDVKSLKKRNYGEIIKSCLDKYGYLKLNLYKNGKRKTFTIHRLVAEAFVENTNNFPVINHKDEHMLNNHYSNLEWCTVKYNNIYGRRIERVATSNSKRVIGFNIDSGYLLMFNSIVEAVKETNSYFNKSGIISCCKGRYKTTKNFKWSYVD